MLYGYFGNDETTANPVPAAGTLHPEDVSPAWRAPKPDAA
jgi:hypothetical protein